MPDILGLRKEVATLRSKILLLAESYIPVVLSVFPFYTQPLPKILPMGFDLLVENDEA